MGSNRLGLGGSQGAESLQKLPGVVSRNGVAYKALDGACRLLPLCSHLHIVVRSPAALNLGSEGVHGLGLKARQPDLALLLGLSLLHALLLGEDSFAASLLFLLLALGTGLLLGVMARCNAWVVNFLKEVRQASAGLRHASGI
jgi:hypothetical protein